MNNNNYTYRIKRIRQLKRLKQSYIALKLGITQQAYSSYEVNVGNKKINQLVKLAEVLEVDVCLIITPSVPINEQTIGLSFSVLADRCLIR